MLQIKLGEYTPPSLICGALAGQKKGETAWRRGISESAVHPIQCQTFKVSFLTLSSTFRFSPISFLCHVSSSGCLICSEPACLLLWLLLMLVFTCTVVRCGFGTVEKLMEGQQNLKTKSALQRCVFRRSFSCFSLPVRVGGCVSSRCGSHSAWHTGALYVCASP